MSEITGVLLVTAIVFAVTVGSLLLVPVAPYFRDRLFRIHFKAQPMIEVRGWKAFDESPFIEIVDGRLGTVLFIPAHDVVRIEEVK